MNSLVNEKILNSLFNDKNFNTELKAMLNEMIDEELRKEPDAMDCDLIDECTNMLIELEQEEDDGFAVLIPMMNSEKIMASCKTNGFKYLSRGMRASLIACIILLSGFTANTVIAKVFDVNIAQEVVNSISEKLQDWGIIADARDNEFVIDEIPATSNTATEEAVTVPATTEKAKEQKEPTTALQKKKTVKQNDSQQNDVKSPVVNENSTKPAQSTTEPTTQTAVQPVDTEPEKEIYTLTFDANGGECNAISIRVEYGKPIGELPVPTREGYEFTGWYNIDISYTYNNGRLYAKKITSDTVYNLKKDSVITADWYECYKVMLYANGGICDKDYVYAYKNTVIDLPIPTRPGYIFLGWYLDEMKVETTEYLYIYGDCCLIAYWAKEGEIFNVTFDAGWGGECDTKNKQVIVGQPYGKLPVPTRKGWNFLGWYDDTEIYSNHITENTVFISGSDSTLYALWYQTKATVVFDANGGNCDMKSKTIYSHNAYGELPTPTRTGYIFKGWYYDDKHIGMTDRVGTYAKDITLIAKWEPVSITIAFDANGGASDKGKDIIYKNYSYMTEYGTFPQAFRQGYKLDGWYTERDGGRRVELTDKVDFLGNTTYYAHWVKDQIVCTVTLCLNDSKNSVTMQSYNKDDKLELYTPSINGGLSFYKFLGWYTDKYYGEKVDSGFIVNEDMTLYAHWTSDVYFLDVTIDKTEYELNEEINLDNMTVKYGVRAGGMEVVISTFTGQELLDAGGKIDFDTSTYGKHTLTVTYLLDLSAMTTIDNSVDIFVKGCPHNQGTYVINKIEPTCIEKGYSGDIACCGCNEIFEKGTETAIIGHDENTVTEIINAKEPTCSEKGYTGDTVCATCNKVLQKGKAIDTVPHSDTEETISKATFTKNGKIEHICKVCGNVASSEIIYSPVVTLSSKVYTYDGMMKTPEIIVKDKNGKLISDYTVEMDGGRTEIGKYNVYISMDSDYYQGETTAAFFIANELKNPDLNITTTSNGFVVTWDAVEGAAGYEVQYQKLAGGDSGTVICFGANNTKAEFKNQRKGQYFVQIRTYQRIDGSNVYTSWSARQLITVG